jgi:hypothetical protein
VDEPFYNSLESALVELSALCTAGPGLYPQFRDRLARVDRLASGVGWGFGDFVADVVAELEAELGEENKEV